jgi:hypothetical protein
MKEIAEIRESIKQALEEERRKFNSVLVFIMYAIVYLFVGAFWFIFLLLLAGVFDKDSYIILLILIIAILVFLRFVFIVPVKKFRAHRNELFSSSEKEVVNKLRDYLNTEKKTFISDLFTRENINKWKIIVNYDIDKLTSYPNKFGSNVKWSEWNELYQKGLICEEEKVKDIIKQKAEELARG